MWPPWSEVVPGRGCGSVFLRSVCRLMLCRKDTEPVPAIKTYTKSKKLRSTRTTISLRSSNRNDQAMTTPASTSMPTTTTRVCIKNLPLSFDEGKLKAHLQSSIASLILTDCKLLKTKDGRSRKIAFVGFKSPEVSDLHEVRRVFSYHLHKICSSRPIVLC